MKNKDVIRFLKNGDPSTDLRIVNLTNNEVLEVVSVANTIKNGVPRTTLEVKNVMVRRSLRG